MVSTAPPVPATSPHFQISQRGRGYNDVSISNILSFGWRSVICFPTLPSHRVDCMAPKPWASQYSFNSPNLRRLFSMVVSSPKTRGIVPVTRSIVLKSDLSPTLLEQLQLAAYTISILARSLGRRRYTLVLTSSVTSSKVSLNHFCLAYSFSPCCRRPVCIGHS